MTVPWPEPPRLPSPCHSTSLPAGLPTSTLTSYGLGSTQNSKASLKNASQILSFLCSKPSPAPTHVTQCERSLWALCPHPLPFPRHPPALQCCSSWTRLPQGLCTSCTLRMGHASLGSPPTDPLSASSLCLSVTFSGRLPSPPFCVPQPIRPSLR